MGKPKNDGDLCAGGFSYVVFEEGVPDATRERILALAGAFPALLKKALEFEAASIPTTAWYILLSQ